MLAASKSGGGAVAKDPQFDYVTLLLHGDGTNGAQNNTFLDSSSNNFTITRNGNTTQGSFSPYGSNWGNYFNGSTDYLQVASGAECSYGTGNFTLEFWMCPDTIDTSAQSNGASCLLDLDTNAGYNTTNWFVLHQVNQSLEFYSNNSLIVATSNFLSATKWYHIAVVRNGSTLSIYANGTSVGSVSYSTAIGSTRNLYIGHQNFTGYSRFFKGYLSNIRSVVGTAVYTSNFTPSTTPLTAISGTSLLTCQSNRFIDNSSNNFALTVNGTPSVQRFSPFSPTSAYSTATIGGSGYFDGSGDYLTVADNAAFEFGTGNFTIEGWINPSSLAAGLASIVTKSDGTGGAYAPYLIGRNGSSIIVRMSSNGSSWDIANAVSFGTLVVGQWSHFALVRNGTTITGYLNGVGTTIATTSSGLVDNTNALLVGGIYAGGSITEFINGYINDVRLVKGTAVYTTTFTPPTAPLTAITNTSLLLNMTNGAIYDNAEMNDLETVGNAQISTSVKKYGTGSLAFDGTGDYLQLLDNPNLAFGSGNFTIEFWVYANSLANNPAIIAKSVATGANTGWFVELASNTVYFGYGTAGGSFATFTVSLTTSTWTHIACTRVGGTLNCFVNGVSPGAVSGFSTGAIDNTNPLFIAHGFGSSTYDYNGYIDDLRITKGVARYTTTFTPPTAAFPNQ